MKQRHAFALAYVVLVCTCVYVTPARGQAQYTITLNASYPNKNLLRPTGIFTSPGSNWLFFSDTGHHMIRALALINNSWGLYNIAGNGTAGYVNSTNPSAAEFHHPAGVSGAGPISVSTNFGVVRFAGINVMDTQNYTVRRICVYFTPMYATPCTSEMGDITTCTDLRG